jgi:serine/threonine protein kinase
MDIKLEPNERKVGQYILGKSIGEGTFGKVKLGRHITTNEKVSQVLLVSSDVNI